MCKCYKWKRHSHEKKSSYLALFVWFYLYIGELHTRFSHFNNLSGSNFQLIQSNQLSRLPFNVNWSEWILNSGNGKTFRNFEFFNRNALEWCRFLIISSEKSFKNLFHNFHFIHNLIKQRRDILIKFTGWLSFENILLVKFITGWVKRIELFGWFNPFCPF